LPEAVSHPPATLWSVFARSLGEQGASGRTALAWRWALTGLCAAPVTLAQAPGQPPSRRELLIEADAPADPAGAERERGSQVIQARFVLHWLASDLDELPLWNGGYADLHHSDGASFAHSLATINDLQSWAMLAQVHNLWAHAPGDARTGMASAWAYGVVQLVDWVCGVTSDGPVTGMPGLGRRPSLYQVSLDIQHAMVARQHAREIKDPDLAARMEAIMETFAWLSGWSLVPPVDRHGHALQVDCIEREAPCACDERGGCLRAACSACWRVPCALGFG